MPAYALADDVRRTAATLLTTGSVLVYRIELNRYVSAPRAILRQGVTPLTKDQINQAQAILKQRGFYAGEQIGKLDDATRDGLRKYQQAEGLKVTGTLNKITLEKMNITLTEKQKTM